MYGIKTTINVHILLNSCRFLIKLSSQRPLNIDEIQRASLASDDDADSLEEIITLDSEEESSEISSDIDDILDMSDTEEINESDTNMFIGRNGTEWNSNPYAIGKTLSHNIIKGQISKVILPPGNHIETTADAFALLFQIRNVMVACTNVQNMETYKIKGNSIIHWIAY